MRPSSNEQLIGFHSLNAAQSPFVRSDIHKSKCTNIQGSFDGQVDVSTRE